MQLMKRSTRTRAEMKERKRTRETIFLTKKNRHSDVVAVSRYFNIPHHYTHTLPHSGCVCRILSILISISFSFSLSPYRQCDYYNTIMHAAYVSLHGVYVPRYVLFFRFVGRYPDSIVIEMVSSSSCIECQREFIILSAEDSPENLYTKLSPVSWRINVDKHAHAKRTHIDISYTKQFTKFISRSCFWLYASSRGHRTRCADVHP